MVTVTPDQLAALLAPGPRAEFGPTGRCRACPEPLDGTLVDRADGSGLHVLCDEPAPIPTTLVAPTCPDCNYDTHRCPGCGEPLPHGTAACAACEKLATRPATFTAPAGPPREHPLKTELIGVIQWRAANLPRSLQTAIGPSELGVDCMRRLAYRLTGTATVNTTADPWFSIVGTAVHDWLSVATDDWNARIANRIHYLAEERVTATNGTFSVTGSCDLYVDGRVVDYKIVGPSALKKYRDRGPSNQYRVQVHTYGLGHQQAGRPVDEVALAFLPRNGYLTDAYVWAEPFQPQVAVDALGRAHSIQQLAQVLPPALIPAVTDEAMCAFCPFYRPGGPADASGCPGPTKTPAQPRR